MRCLALVATGRVQGVGYRDRVLRAAEAQGIVGSVRNAEDGSVEIVAQGEEGALKRFVEAVHGKAGLSDAREVRLLAEREVEPALSRFRIVR